MILTWEGGKLSKQVNLDKDSNCGFIRTVPSYRKHEKFAMAMNAHIIKPDDEWRKSAEPELDRINHDDHDIDPITRYNFNEGEQAPEKLHQTHKSDELQRALWRWHLKLNHLSFAKIRVMSLQGVLTKG